MEQPWRSNKNWARTVRSDARRNMWFVWVFAGLWNVIAWPAAVGSDGPWFVPLFPAVGLGLVWFAARASRQWRRYGATRLTLDPYPGSIGGHVGGWIDLGRAAGAGGGYEVTLECLRSYYSGSGKNRSRRYDVKWQARGPAEVTRSPSGWRVDFRFDVPAGLPASERKRGDYHLWRLRLTGDQDEVPVDRTFEIAVFPTAERSETITADTTAAGRAAAREGVAAALGDRTRAAGLRRELKLDIEQRGDWLRLLLLPGRQKLLAALFGCVGVVFLGVALLNGEAGALLRAVFAVIGLCGTAVGLYLPFNSLDVRISPREIKRVRTWCGIVLRRQRVRPAELRELEITQGGQVTVNDRVTVYYRLEGKGPFGTIRLLESVPDRGLVEALREQVIRHAGLAPV